MRALLPLLLLPALAACDAVVGGGGRVVDPLGQPVAGASILLESNGRADSTRTDDDGRFSTHVLGTLATGTHPVVLTVRKSGFAITRRFFHDEGALRGHLTFQLDPASGPVLPPADLVPSSTATAPATRRATGPR